MPASDIVIRGAREHNLRNVVVDLPRNQLICLTGVSGSGKSSLAFDTLYAEGQRRYVESLSSFARQFLGQMPKPDVDHISGLSPSISISAEDRRATTRARPSARSPRSTISCACCSPASARGTARSAAGRSRPRRASRSSTASWRCRQGRGSSSWPRSIRGQKGEYKDLFEDLLKQGFVRARVDGAGRAADRRPQLDRQMRHNIEVVIDRLKAERRRSGRGWPKRSSWRWQLGEGNVDRRAERGRRKPRPAKARSSRLVRRTSSSPPTTPAPTAA